MLRHVTPIDGSVDFERPWAEPAAIDQALDDATRAQQEWARTPWAERRAIVERFAARLEARAEELGPELATQMGRPVRYAAKELLTCAERAKVMCRLAESALAPVAGDDKPGFELYVERVPLGVVLVVPAWNFPWMIAVNAIAPALIAGNAVVLKHSSQTPLVGERYAELLAEAGLPRGVFQNLHATHEQTEKMVADPRVSFVAFTGSVKGGHKMVQAAAGRFIDQGLELGGKDPAYVRADADVAYAAEQIADGAFFNSGQSCCGVERVYVHQSVFQPVVEGIVDAVRGLRLGDPRDPETSLGPLARASGADYVRAEVKAALSAGAKSWLQEGDFPASRAGTAYLAPQVLTDVHHAMSVMSEETFGPVVGIMPVADDDEAIRYMNDSVYGLTASVWTRDIDAAKAIGARVETGTFFVNRCDFLEPSLAWVGVKDSGRGQTLSALGFERLTRPKSFHIKTETV